MAAESRKQPLELRIHENVLLHGYGPAQSAPPIFLEIFEGFHLAQRQLTDSLVHANSFLQVVWGEAHPISRVMKWPPRLIIDQCALLQGFT